MRFLVLNTCFHIPCIKNLIQINKHFNCFVLQINRLCFLSTFQSIRVHLTQCQNLGQYTMTNFIQLLVASFSYLCFSFQHNLYLVVVCINFDFTLLKFSLLHVFFQSFILLLIGFNLTHRLNYTQSISKSRWSERQTVRQTDSQ